MNRNDVILHTKLNPPRLPRHTLVRPRIDALIRDAFEHRVTIVQAGTGYGKSTALANLAESTAPFFWYSASEGDADPKQFVAHLVAAFRVGLPALDDAPAALLHDGDVSARQIVDALLNTVNESLESRAILVIDDYHLAASEPVDSLVDHFLAFLPPHLHVIVSTRYAPAWENLVTWRARGDALEIKRDALAFTPEEIDALFRTKYAKPLTSHEVATLHEKTEGWPIALQLVWQEIRKSKTNVADLLARGAESLDTLFAYLAHDVLAQQPRDIQNFLLQTATLRELESGACLAVTCHGDSRAMLNHLRERDLFLITLSDQHYRYHHLFHDFLREHAARVDGESVRERHRRAAEFYRNAGDFDEAMYHLLRANEFGDAARLIEEIGEEVLRSGRLDTLSIWLDALPPDLVAAHPLLMFLLGDMARLRSRFDDALAWYTEAERAWRANNDVSGRARALRGQALVYLDTVRPPQAERLLQKALRLTDGLDDRVARARLLELLAENKLNVGKAEQAEQLRVQARTLREEGPSEDTLSVRVKLRTGRLDEAREILEMWAHEERGKPHPPRAHRETLLVLSLIYSMQGDADAAFATAQEGIALGAQFNSPFVTVVGHLRLGHAHQIRANFQDALRCYEDAVALGDQIPVRRPRAEAMWGLTRAHGFAGDLKSAERDAAQGIEIAASAGDAWLVALIQIALGASQVIVRRGRDAVENLTHALAAMRSCGDTFGQCAARVWLALAHWRLNQKDRALAHLAEGLSISQARRYDFLFTATTLTGMPDARIIVPLLLDVRKRGKHSTYITRLLAAMGLENVTTHPGYQLRVQTLGAFRVFRGEVEITAREWTRKKARQLLQLFVTRRGRWIERDEICDLLWANESPDAAVRDFKVALNALNKAIEPERVGDEPVFIARAESAYGLRAGADVWVDADEFLQLVARAESAPGDGALALYRRALELYHDDYLVADARYDDWAVAERERLLALYLRSADRLASELLARGVYDDAIAWCGKILARDRCWEHAYRLMLRAHAGRGDRAQARRVFEQCVRILQEDLDVEPSETTQQVYRECVGER